MESNLSCYELKTDYYRHKLLYVSLIVTTKQKPIVNTQKIKRQEYKYITKESNQTTSEDSNLEKEEQSWRHHVPRLQTILQSYRN